MTAVRKSITQKLNLARRDRGEVFVPRPCAGDHEKLVRAALDDVLAKDDEILRRLAKR